jgi:hypothetical protein
MGFSLNYHKKSISPVAVGAGENKTTRPDEAGKICPIE